MMSTSHKHGDSLAAPLRGIVAPVELAGGWIGQVVARPEGCGDVGSSGMLLPTLPTWCEWLSRLAVNADALPGFATLKYSGASIVCRARIDVPGDGRSLAGTHPLDPASVPRPSGSGPSWLPTTAEDTNAADQHNHAPVNPHTAIEVVCKRSQPKPGLERFLAALRSSRAQRNFAQSRQLLDAGVATAKPLAWITQRSGSRASWFVAEFVPGLADLDRIAMATFPRLSGHEARQVRSGLSLAVAELLLSLRRAGLHHRDMKASNVLVSEADLGASQPRCVLLDLDGLRRAGRWRRNEWRRPLVRLAASLHDYSSVKRSDYLRCLRRYASGIGLLPDKVPALFRSLADDARRYAERSRTRNHDKLDGYAGTRSE
ncbi:MAG: lipopolysaccharide kinase InaA family protein [Planctomycetota bacterium]